jgi:hypothetical protein
MPFIAMPWGAFLRARLARATLSQVRLAALARFGLKHFRASAFALGGRFAQNIERSLPKTPRFVERQAMVGPTRTCVFVTAYRALTLAELRRNDRSHRTPRPPALIGFERISPNE